jgi:hypothetical protein
MRKPIKYYQIMTPATNGILRPFEVNQFGEVDSFFESEGQAEQFIADHFLDAQQEDGEKKELVLIILPVFICQFKK